MQQSSDFRMTTSSSRRFSAIDFIEGFHMTEFTETALRHMCRNPRCRSKLPAPVSNPREAFCAKVKCRSAFRRARSRPEFFRGLSCRHDNL
jgi:hypothetical protein